MDLYTVQLVFYTLGIIFMLSLIALVGVLIYVLVEINKTVREAIDSARIMIRDVKHDTVDRVQEIFDQGSSKLLATVGMGVAGAVLNTVKNKLFSKKRS